MTSAPDIPLVHSGDERLSRLISPECRLQIRDEIAANGGSEVFFLGRLNTNLMVEEVEALAYGNKRAVPAILQYARSGDVVLHNHPSGHIEPSDADITISSELGSRGVGSYIIDNECSRIRIVVKPFKQAGVHPIDARELGNNLRPGGRIAEQIDNYEERPQQIEMLEGVCNALNRDGIAVIEAGTGTGKSMAYLLPSIAWAIKNNEKVVIATHTINLQEQLIEKDLPLLLQTSGLKFQSALLKGRGNYLCRRKAHYLKTHPDFLDNGEKDQQMAQIQAWIKTTKDGSLSDLPFQPDADVWEQVMSEADNCLRARCQFYQQCFFYNARRRAAAAQVLVVNHHLLMADLAVRAETGNYTGSAVLPPFHRIVIDEAHHLDEVATGYFGARVSRAALVFPMRRLMKPKTGDGLFSFIANKVHAGLFELTPADHDAVLMKLSRELPLQHKELRDAMEETVDLVCEQFERQPAAPLDQAQEIKRRIKDEDLQSPFWTELVNPLLRSVITASRPYLENLRVIIGILSRAYDAENAEAATPVLELQSTVNKIESVIQRIMRFLGDATGQCRWLEYRRGPGGRRRPDVFFCIAPLEIAPQLREHVLRRFKSVVMTSATLAIERKFDYFLRQIGAGDAEQLSLLGSSSTESSAEDKTENPSRLLRTLLLDTPFDFDNQIYLGVPFDLPDPTEPAFEAELSGFLEHALVASRGRAFVLFTAYSLLQKVFNRIAPELEAQGYPCMRQGQVSRTLLTESFRREIGSILFATSSFWEGVDVQGEALSCLVLTRLPFRVPGEPLIEARVEELRKKRLDPFQHLIIPEAVIKFRQGFGRLIRSRTDRGAVLICDKRVITKHYGKMFLSSLPTSNVHNVTCRKVVGELQNFFSNPEHE